MEGGPPTRVKMVDLHTREETPQKSTECVVVIDDDSGSRDSLGRLLRSVGLHPELFASVDEFEGFQLPDAPTCLILDVRLPGRSGLDLQRHFAAVNVRFPIIFITGFGDIPMSVQAMKRGAIEFLEKPFREQDLLDAVNIGLTRDLARREQEKDLHALRARFNVLTQREWAILIQVAKGRLNKQIAGEMGITETTVKVHRSNMMRKIKAASLAELCRMVDKLEMLPEKSEPL